MTRKFKKTDEEIFQIKSKATILIQTLDTKITENVIHIYSVIIAEKNKFETIQG